MPATDETLAKDIHATAAALTLALQAAEAAGLKLQIEADDGSYGNPASVKVRVWRMTELT